MSREMQAILVEDYDGIDNINISTVPVPEISNGHVRIRVQAAGVGYVDGLKVQGKYQTLDPLPFIPGSEFAGVVDAVASDVDDISVGTSVIGLVRSGALAQYVCAPRAALHPMPKNVPPEIGAGFFANYLTALYALQSRAALEKGDDLLVLGASGGVGIAAVKIGKLLGARVIAAASTKEKRDFCIANGADISIDYTTSDWRNQLKKLTEGRGANIIFDPVGGEIAVQAFRSIAWRGRHLVIGFASGEIAALPFNLPLLKGGALLGVDLAQIGRREPNIQRQCMQQLIGWLSDGSLTPAIGKVFALEDFRAAFLTMTTRSALGKMIVSFESST